MLAGGFEFPEINRPHPLGWVFVVKSDNLDKRTTAAPLLEHLRFLKVACFVVSFPGAFFLAVFKAPFIP